MKPEYLYHYTDAAGLVGIAQGKMLWASGLRYMNDALEDKFADYQAAKFIRKKALLLELDKIQRAGMYQIADRVEKEYSHEYTFAFSTSEESDLLSQWRGYTPNGGYSIGFFYDSIEEIAASNSFTLAKCIYNTHEQERLVAEKIESYLDSIQNWEVSTEEGEDIAKKISYKIWPLRPIFKHPSFAEEKEWRMFGNVNSNDARSKWRARGAYVHPYVELPFEVQKNKRGNMGPIDTIWFSPGLDTERAYGAISHLMHACEMHFQYRESTSPFR